MHKLGSRRSYRKALAERFLIRFHMFLIMTTVLLSGVIGSKLLRALGVTSMAERYGLAVLLSYGPFFVLIRLWLWHVDADRGMATRSDGSDERSSQADLVEDGVDTVVDVADGIGSGSWRGGGSSLDLDEGIVLVLLVIVVVAILGGSLYLIWEAPAILSDAAFQMVLLATLRPASRRLNQPGWAGSVLRATWIPFAIVLVLAVVFGALAQRHCPGSTSLSEVIACIRADEAPP